MRRPFPRTPRSPQVSITVETPTHRYSDALITDELHFSEVVIGSVEPIMSFVPKNNCKSTQKKFYSRTSDCENHINMMDLFIIMLSAHGLDSEI